MPDLLIRNARVGGATTDVLVRAGRIEEVRRGLTDPGVESVDADGRWLLPGLWDHHVHLGQWALAAKRLDLSSAATPEAALALVAEAVERGGPVVGMGHRAGTWSRPVTVGELDGVSGATPVVLVNADFHHGWLNTAALDALGLPRRDTIVAEREWFDAYPRLTGLTGAPTPADYRHVLQQAATLGIVGLVDFEFDAPHTDWLARWGDGCDLLRIRWSPYSLDGLRLRTGDVLRPGLTVGPLKIISDGSLGTRTAWCCEPYADTGRYGAPNCTAEELRGRLAEAVARGFTVATHAIGDRALAQALDAYAATGAQGSIEHAQLIGPDSPARLAALGLTASVQPAHLLDDHQTTDRVWPDRAGRSFAFRDLLDAGVRLAFGSDAPVARLDPWLAIDAAVERAGWHPEQSLTRREALAASVDGRRVAPGEPGDLILLDADPLVATPSVGLTVVAGRIVHRR